MHIHPVRKFAAVATLAFVAVGLAACGGSDDSAGDSGSGGLIKVRIAHNSNAAVLPARIAGEKGFFKEHGLDVDFTVVENIGTLPPAVGKSFDIVQVPPTSLISATSQNIHMVGVAAATLDVKDNPTSGIIALKSSGIKSYADLKGKTLGVLTETGTLHTATLFALDKAGVPLDSIKIVQVDGPAQADQLKSGRIDAVETLAPFRATLLSEGNTVELGDPYLEMAPELSAMMWGTSSDWAKKHPEAIGEFREALQEGIDYIGAHEDEARAVLKDFTGLPEDVVQKTILPTYVSDPRAQDLKVWLDAMTSVGGFKGDVSLDDLLPTDAPSAS